MKIGVFGCGAAGNKVAINLIEKEIVSVKDTFLVNSTIKDIPERYRDNAIIFSSSTIGGCGKERDRGKSLLLESLKNEKINLESTLSPYLDMVVLCSSVEGGSGSASITILAKYFKEVIGINVCVVLLFGFEDDIRGLQNSIEVCQELSDEYTIIGISNKKFLSDANGNKLKAEKMANDEVANRINILIGNTIGESEQNIDETDIYKLSTTPGYMDIGYFELPKIKNVSMYNSSIIECIDNTKSLDITNISAKRLGVIFTINKKTEDYIDFSSQVLRERFGLPYEYFTHVQYTDGAESVAFIAAGMDMPIDEVESVYNKYKEQTEKVKKSKDNFFETVNQFKGDPKDAMFNMGSTIDNRLNKVTDDSKKKFFENFDVSVEVNPSKFTNTKKKNNDDSIEKY